MRPLTASAMARVIIRIARIVTIDHEVLLRAQARHAPPWRLRASWALRRRAPAWKQRGAR